MALPGLAALAPLAAGAGGALLSRLASRPGSVGEFLGGTPAQEQRFERFTPEQTEVLNAILQQALGGIQQREPVSFEPIAQKARTGFQQQTVPALAERFTSLGRTPGALSSPAFAGALGQAGVGLEESLAAQRAAFDVGQQRNQQQMLLSLLGLGLTPRFETAYQPRQAGFLESGTQQLLSALPLLGLLRS